MSNDIYIWKSNKLFKKQDAGNIAGQLAEADTKPDQIDASDLIEKLITSISTPHPPLERDPSSVWGSSFICSDWHCTVSMSYASEYYVDAFIDLQSECKRLGLTLYDTSSGDVFPNS